MLPLFADQPDNARRVTELGAGMALEGTVGLGDAVRRLLREPSFRRAAETVAAEIAALPPTDRIVDVLHDVARGEAVAA